MTQARIFQINASDGGVPKRPLRQAEINELGLTVDKQIHTKVHGGPERAVCLYSLERILALQAEGHPIYPGSVGENITISGLDWDAVVPGARLRLGDVLIEITSFASPCDLIEESFADRDSQRISHKKYPGWARAYSRVQQPGIVKIGDEVTLESPDE
ncbi:MAG: MOSC domain-containing protein [Ardenticatenaceae bacterium]|nr:MOSC domain-containing protein [Ardenticatenaceae bacterium]MCB9445982.1 MOSC domain-containing protein [Ardenticatenaceae bacterium]